MKTLFILRHAKSDWDNPALSDFDRPLNERGQAAAPKIGAYFKLKHYACDVVLCSPAKRTRETFALIKPYLRDGVMVKFDDKLYLAEPKYMVGCLLNLNDDVQSAMILGHNPGLEQLAHALIATERDEASTNLLKRMRDKFSTCALAVIGLPVKTWKDVKLRRGELRDFMRPRDL